MIAPKGKRPVSTEVFKDLPVAEGLTWIPDEVKKEPDLFIQIGEEKAFEVDIISPGLTKREIVRLKYRHRLDLSMPPLLAPAPARLMPDGYASGGTAQFDRALQVS